MSQAAAPSRRDSRELAGGVLDPLVQWTSLPKVINAVVPLLLIGMATAPLEGVYLDAGLWVTVVVALLLGGLLAVVGAAYRMGVLTMISLSVILFFVAGALAAPSTAFLAVLPTPTTWQLMGVGTFRVWKHVLTVNPPLGTGGVVLLLPYVLAYVGAVVAVTISLRARRLYNLSLLIPAAVLVTSILFATHVPVLAGVLGVLAVLITTTWVPWRSGRLEPSRILAMALVLGVAAVGGTAASTFASPASQRVVLRDYVQPPPDPENYPSPLAGFRDYADELSDENLFSVSDMPEQQTLLRLAALDSYDGLTWNVSGSGPGSGVFRRIGKRVEVDVPQNAYSLDVSVEEYSDVWLLNAGGTVDVDFAGPDQDDLSESLYYNSSTDTGLVTARLNTGDSFELVADPVAQQEPEDVTSLQVSRVRLPEPQNVPEAVGKLAADFSEDANSPYSKIEAIASAMQNQGFFSHGLEGEVPSSPGHGQARLQTMLSADQMVGDEEQYAAAMALMVRSLGYPARVVLGFDVTDGGTVSLTGDDVIAWVEVPFDGAGWVPFFPTPPEDQIPQTEDPDPVDHPQPEVLQPPPPPEEPPEVPPQDRDDAQVDVEAYGKDTFRNPWALVSIAVTVPILVLLSPLALILLIKELRRRRRRSRGDSTQQITGGWNEIVDSFLDLGVVPGRGLTRRESATYIESQVPDAHVLTLADGADMAVFGPDEPDQSAAAHYWRELRRAAARVAALLPWQRRWRARVSIRSLRRKK